MWPPFPKVPYRRMYATIGQFQLHQFCQMFSKSLFLCFCRFLERSRVLSSHQCSYRKNLGTCDTLLDIVCADQMELYGDGKLTLVQIDFSTVFDKVNHGVLVFKLQEAGVGGMILKVFQNFCPNVLRESR